MGDREGVRTVHKQRGVRHQDVADGDDRITNTVAVGIIDVSGSTRVIVKLRSSKGRNLFLPANSTANAAPNAGVFTNGSKSSEGIATSPAK